MPADLKIGADGMDLFKAGLEWKVTAACEATKRQGLIQTWPR